MTGGGCKVCGVGLGRIISPSQIHPGEIEEEEVEGLAKDDDGAASFCQRSDVVAAQKLAGKEHTRAIYRRFGMSQKRGRKSKLYPSLKMLSKV